MTIPAGRRRRPAFAAGLAVMAMALGFTAIPAEAGRPPRVVDYVAVGDSYTAGTGADTTAGAPAPPWVPTLPCTQTGGGYVDIVSTTASIVPVDNAACHGALIKYPTWDGVPSIEQQISSLASEGNLSKDTELVSMTAGANDVGVNQVLGICATAPAEACALALQEAVGKMETVGGHLIQAFAAIHQQAPRARIVMLGYPRLFYPTEGQPIPKANQELVNAGTAKLNGTIALAAAAANTRYDAHVQYVDVTARFTGHETNTAAPWIYLATVVTPTGEVVFDPRSFHPTQAGHAQYAEALLASVNLKQLARP